MNADILSRIQLRMSVLSRAEAQVGQWILGQPRATADGSIAQLAAAAGVSEPTIVRFCRSLGLSGYRELRTQLMVSLQNPQSFLHQDVDATDEAVDAVGKVLDTSVAALVNLRALASSMPFESAIDEMRSARQFVFVGLGASGLVARDAAHKFFRLGIPCTTATDSQTILQSAAISQPGDVFLATSYLGNWPELVEAMVVAKNNGAVVIAITDPTSPLASVAQLTFESHPDEDTNLYTPMSSRLVQLALLDALQVALALSLGADAEEKLRRSKQALVKFRQDAARPSSES